MVGGGVPGVFATLEDEEEGAQPLVGESDDGALVATTNDQRLKLGVEHADLVRLAA